MGPVEVVVAFTAFIAASYGFGIYLFPTISEAIREDISFSYRQMGIVTGAVQVGFLVASLAAGLLTLRFGAMPLVLASILTCAICLGAAAIAKSVFFLAVLLVVLGACASLIWVPMVEVVRETVPKSSRGRALGLMSSGTSYGVFVNSGLLAVVLPIAGWRAIWLIASACVCVLAAYSLARLRVAPDAPIAEETPPPQPEGKGKGKSVLARLRSLPTSLVALILAMMFLNGFSCMSFQTFLSAYLIGEIGMSETRAAGAWATIGVVGMFSGFLVGALADRITIRRGILVTCAVLFLAAGLAPFGDKQGVGSTLVYCSTVAFGISFYAIFGLVPAYISHKFGEGNAALVFSMGNVTLGLGGMVGNLTGGFAKDAFGTFVPLYAAIAVASVLSCAIAAYMPSETEEASGDA